VEVHAERVEAKRRVRVARAFNVIADGEIVVLEVLANRRRRADSRRLLVDDLLDALEERFDREPRAVPW
jgi:hypothetical protein